MDKTTAQMILAGAFGGVLPTLAALAATYSKNPQTDLPTIGLYLALILWAIVGAGVALTNKSKQVRNAILAGIAAPGIISGVIRSAQTTQPAGAQKKTLAVQGQVTSPQTGKLHPMASPQAGKKRELVPSMFGDFLWGLGAQRAFQVKSIEAHGKKGMEF